jgi:hypothetical protein
MLSVQGVPQKHQISFKERIMQEYSLKIDDQPVNMGTSTQDFFDPYEYYPMLRDPGEH